MRIALAVFESTDNLENNISGMIELIYQASEGNCNVILFSETVLTGFIPNIANINQKRNYF